MDTKTLSIVGLILGILVPIAGIIVSAIALNKMKQTGVEEGKGMAMAGLIIGIVIMAIYILMVGCLCIAGAGLAAAGY